MCEIFDKQGNAALIETNGVGGTHLRHGKPRIDRTSTPKGVDAAALTTLYMYITLCTYEIAGFTQTLTRRAHIEKVGEFRTQRYRAYLRIFAYSTRLFSSIAL